MANSSPALREVRQVKVQPIFAPNDAEQAIAEAYRARAASLPGADNEALAGLRQRAMTRFEATGLPHRRMEAWKYTDLRRHLAKLPEAGELQGDLPQITEMPLYRAFAGLNPHWLVFIDGAYAPSLSDGPALSEGVEVRALSDGPLPGWAVDEIAATAAGDIDAVFDLNTALMADGVLIRISKDVDAKVPLAILHLGQNSGMHHLRHVVAVENGATLSLIEAYGAIGACKEVATAAVNWRISDDAVLDHVKVQLVSEASTHLAPQLSTIGANTRLSSFTLTLGAALSREQRHVLIAGQDSQVSVSGTYLLGGKQHGDTTLVVTHAAPGCESRERFKGLVDDAARGVFQGSVIVECDAQKTDARQSVDALLLSDDARHDAKPELEIYADDVQCGHGATTGELDENALFYLRARALAKKDAERLLIQSFIHDGIEAVEHQGLRAALIELVDQRLGVRRPGESDA